MYFTHIDLPKVNGTVKVIRGSKAAAEDLQKMQDAIERMVHSKLDLVLFCNAYESEEIAYENRNLRKAVLRGKHL